MKSHLAWTFCLPGVFPSAGALGSFSPMSKPPKAGPLLASLQADSPKRLNIAVVGAGPSGLLLSHLLLKQQDPNTQITLLESRSDPRQTETEQRAYALGIGMRGRTAIRKVDEQLWQVVKRRGFESQRFQLHIGSLVIPLRSEKDGGEPSLLLYQSELCAALTEELEKRHESSGRLRMSFDTKVNECDLNTMKLNTESGSTDLESFDLIVGCDGVKSPVRTAISKVFPTFETELEKLRGNFKVVRLISTPPNVDPTAVSLMIPGGAFIEPTGYDGSCCILFSGRPESPLLSEVQDKNVIMEALEKSFPQWKDFHEEIARQLMSQKVLGSASSVVCNTYHYSDKAVLVGDAAHATGGVSGQGVNSALMDSVALAECIQQNRSNITAALMAYSLRQVPEGKALYDLSFGPKPKGFKAFIWALRNARDTLFRGKFGIGQPPLQTRLTTNLTPFAEIRRETDDFYGAPFPTEAEFADTLLRIHKGEETSATDSA